MDPSTDRLITPSQPWAAWITGILGLLLCLSPGCTTQDVDSPGQNSVMTRNDNQTLGQPDLSNESMGDKPVDDRLDQVRDPASMPLGVLSRSSTHRTIAQPTTHSPHPDSDANSMMSASTSRLTPSFSDMQETPLPETSDLTTTLSTPPHFQIDRFTCRPNLLTLCGPTRVGSPCP